ncbi:MAG: NAD-dependent epimerase/dehydratase family protein [Acidimicrobiaceae bacterium]|nr:NAD-dependent epimerase/dehydratase family protein [Acidimicrobiaceae bacterium]MXY11412.1 NAD-dependent epimerase/dehydratase family protein [Acidimicrobiaceae bacterium]MXZ66013.1 NAD-dependent epimerase/dehydratase family protein [Acidimicrobiaceae bacterium]MYA13738.1 NAD-dependent epimerase/dehydratase family protein [Acidimicrobiaceae bacterium]MYE55932.1 NAD-dependent epimerase/dehydratase family protein [Acidimicrobiaceae bacterium]
MRVLVMGGTQFNGRALVNELVRAGHEVTVCNRGRTPAVLPAGVRRLTADRTDHQSLRDALGGTDWDCVHDLTAYHPPDVEMMLELLDGRTGHYVFASSTVIYAASNVLPVAEDDGDERGPDQNEYGLHKLLCEDLLRAAHAERGFPATTVVFSMVFGPHNTLHDREQRMFARVLSDRPVLVPGDGTTLLQLGHVDDQARALEQMMGKPVTFGRRYNLTGRQSVTRNGYVDLAERVVGRPAHRVPIPAGTMERLWTGELRVGSGAMSLGMDIRSSAGSERVARNPRADMLRRRLQVAQLVQHLAPNIWWWNRSIVFSVDRLRSDIGWEPSHDLTSMFEHTFDWYQRSGRAEADATRFDWTFEDALLHEIG